MVSFLIATVVYRGNAMTYKRESVAADWDQATLTLNGVQIQPRDKHLLFRGQENILTVEFPSPIVSVLRLGVGNNEEGLKLEATPPFNSDVKDTFSWTIKPDEGLSGPVVLVLYSAELLFPLGLDGSVISPNLDSELRVLLDGVAIPPSGATFTGEGTQTLTLDYLNGELLKNVPLALDAVLESGFVPGDITGVPSLRELTTQHEWKVTWPDKDGSFKLKLYSEQEKALLMTPDVRVRALEKVTFGFLPKHDSPPVLIERFFMPDNFLMTNVGVILMDAAGRPLKDIPVTVSQPYMEDAVLVIDGDGRRPVFIVNEVAVVGHTFKVIAVAPLLDGVRTAELLVEVVGAS
ncbi:hypothetical protein IB245_10000 [Pseudomonas sp. PDM02]|uniref:hypothetical protein n=1 Tax=Pseudomonas sp. PDM02 TaxID=2769267 RepID=UPI00177C42E1|nr:hypothetical protein [Pseudomonas sp. PDM02]MBD9611830.1 hypothetical protein [Pseudomonas sp. PDM02]